MKKNYKFTDETKVVDGHTLHRIVAVNDIPEHNVKAGDIGGWVEHFYNLSENAWVGEESCVYGMARVRDEAHIYGSAHVSGKAWVSGSARVGGDARVFDDAWVRGEAHIFGDAHVFGRASVGRKEEIGGYADIFCS